MAHFKFSCYVGLMTLGFAAVGLFFPTMVYLFGHTTWMLIHGILRLTDAELFWISMISWTALGLWMGWRKGRRKFFTKELKQISL
jgi:hypothetical protein